MGFRMELVQGATPICEGSCHLTPLRDTSCWNDCKSCKVRVGSNGNSLWEASVLLGRKKGREGVREFFQQHGSEAKRKLSRGGRNQMGNEPVIALPEGADDFIVYYDARSKDLEVYLVEERGRLLVSKRWAEYEEDVASCGSKYLGIREWTLSYKGFTIVVTNLEFTRVEGKKILKDVIAKLPRFSSGYDANWVCQMD
ncbi:hypothetical protein Tco_0013765 [Tanacetum coccineum]